jgi:hypothetical protein
MNRVLKGITADRGQMLMMFVLTMSVVFVMGFVVIDFGLWFSERRGAQKDADLSALAAAQELLGITQLSDPDAGQVQDAANDRAWAYAQKNDVIDIADVHLPNPSDASVWTACWADQGDISNTIDSFPLDIEHDAGALFATIFGWYAPDDLGAHARACVGSINSMAGVMPVGVPIKNPDLDGVRDLCWAPDDDVDPNDTDPSDNDDDDLPEPLYGKRCDLTVKDGDSGEYGWLDLDNPCPLGECAPSNVCSEGGGGANELGEEVEYGGANTYCRVAPIGATTADCQARSTNEDPWNWCVEAKTGLSLNKLMEAFNTLVKDEGACDGPDADDPEDGKVDDFEYSVELQSGTEGTDSAFYDEICDSPRIITLVIIDSYTSAGNPVLPIRAFASFFIEGVAILDNDGMVVVGEYPKFDPQGNIGQFFFYGRFMNIVGDGGAGYVTDWSPKRVLLDE